MVPRTALMALLRIRDFRRLWLGQTLSLLGTGITMAALPVLVVERTGSMLAAGAAPAAAELAEVLAEMVLVHLTRGWDRKAVLVAADVVRAVLVLGMAEAAAGWPLIALAGGVGAATGLYFPTRAAILPEVVGREHLQHAAALAGLAATGASMVGPALGGVIVAAAGAPVALAVDAATYLVSAWANATARYPRRSPGGSGDGAPAGAWAGLRRIYGDPVLLRAHGAFLALAALGGAAPLLALRAAPRLPTGPERAYGFLLAGLSAGMLAGNALAARVSRSGRDRVLRVAPLASGLGLLPAALPLPWPAAVAGMVTCGACQGLVGVVGSVIFAEHTPLELRALVYGQGSAVVVGVHAAARVVTGRVLDARPPAVAVGAQALVACGLAAATAWRARCLERGSKRGTA